MGIVATVVIRTRDEVTKQRRWVKATGKRSDPVGRYYLRYSVGRVPCYEQSGDRYDIALADKIKLERRLKAQALGVPVPNDTPTVPGMRYRIIDLTVAHIAEQSKPDKNGDFRSDKSLGAIRADVQTFLDWSGKTFVHELTPKLLKDYRDWLLTTGNDGKPYEPDTARNKLMQVAVVLKNNPIAPTAPLLPLSQFPDKKITIPDPYTREEFEAFMKYADYETALQIFALISTGMRDQEIANAERSDIDWELGYLYIVKKRERNFKGKNTSARRPVPLNDVLLAELALRPNGLLFPAPRGGVNKHFIRCVKKIAAEAGIKGTTDKPHMVAAGMKKDDWVHRFRDTFITNQLHLHCANMAETMQMCQSIGHKNMATLPKYFGKLKTPYEPIFPEHHRKAKGVKSITQKEKANAA